MQWKVGDVTVTRVREHLSALPSVGFIQGVTPELLAAHDDWLRPDYLDEDDTFPLSVHALVLESEGRRIVVDTCFGDRPIPGMDELSHLGTGFIEALAEAGHPPESVDTVLCTHLHFDHVGWNTRLVDGEWVPTFPNARYLFARIEYEHWDAGAEGFATTFGDAVRPVVDAGLADLVDTDHVVTGEVSLVPTPGHTPGHVSVRIASAGATAVITGDMCHHPIQLAEPELTTSADVDPDRGVTTRRDFVAEVVDRDTLVFGTHFGGSSCGHVRRDGDRVVFRGA